MSAPASERGIIPEGGEITKPFGRVVIADREGNSRDAVTTILSSYAKSIEHYDSVTTALDGILSQESEISLVISGYSLPDDQRRTGADVIRAVREKFPKARGMLLTTIPDLINRTPEVAGLAVPLIAREDPTIIRGKTEDERIKQAYDSREAFKKEITEALFGPDVIL